jgi:serine/threonine protein kinase
MFLEMRLESTADFVPASFITSQLVPHAFLIYELVNNRGSFSTVRRGRHKETGKEYAVKCIQKKFIKMHLLEREIKIMKKVSQHSL